jgi:hypothetical protein
VGAQVSRLEKRTVVARGGSRSACSRGPCYTSRRSVRIRQQPNAIIAPRSTRIIRAVRVTRPGVVAFFPVIPAYGNFSQFLEPEIPGCDVGCARSRLS